MNTQYWHYLFLFCLAFIWGSSFILIKKSLVFFNPYEIALLRIVIAWVALLPFTIKEIPKMNKKIIAPIIIVGIIGNLVPAFLFAKAQTKIDSSLAGMLNSLVPIFTLIIGYVFFKTNAQKNQLIGLIIGLLGTVMLLFNNMKGEINNFTFLIILATICYAINLNTIKSKLNNISSINIAGFSFIIIGPVCFFLLFFTNFFVKLSHVNNAYIGLIYVSILSIFGTSLAIIIFNYLIKKTSALFTSSVTYLIPVVAIFWGIGDGEAINQHQLFSLFVILAGIYLIKQKETKN